MKLAPPAARLGQILVLARDFVVHVLKNDDQHAVKMVGGGSRCGTRGFFLLSGGGLRHSEAESDWVGGARRDALRRLAVESARDKDREK